ncbi:MAG: phosphatase PAP2 family protein [Firmicutes bacterium]|nr:phosphatase PAP2 family protein [Bacillota bacterium]
MFTKYGILGLSVVAFAEASFFPVPPDVVLIPLCLMSPGLALWYAFLCTVFSTLGGVFGHVIGGAAGRPLLERLAGTTRTRQTEGLFARYGGWAILIAALTPIPYKVFTIASGVFRVSKVTLVWASLLGRGMRFFLEAAVIMIMGPAATQFLARYSGIITIGIAVALIVGYILSRHVGTLLAVRKQLIDVRDHLELMVKRFFRPEWEFAVFIATGLTLGLSFLFIFTELAEDLFENELYRLDNAVTLLVRTVFGPGAVGTMRLLSMIGSPVALIGVALVASYILHHTGRRLDCLTPPLALAGGVFLESFLKAIFQRPRPDYPRLVEASGFSFPSGHATVSTAVLGALVYLLLVNIKPGRGKLVKPVILLAGLLLILMIGASRVYLGVHYPSDVLAGFAIGGFWAICCIVSVQVFREIKR